MKKNKRVAAASGRSATTGTTLALLEQGARLYNERRFSEARALLQPELAKLPADPGLNSLMGQVALATDEHEAALGHFDQVLLQLRDHPEILAHRAMCLLKLGRKEEAREALEHILVLAPRNVVTLKYLGALNGDGGDHAKAEEYLRRALSIDPDEPEVLALLGKTLLEMNRNDEARPVIKRAIKRNPKWATPFNLLGATYRQQCRFRTALSCYRRAWKNEPEDLASSVNYAVGLLDTGRVHEAIAHSRNYLERNPSCDQMRFNMATALLQIGQLAEGWEAYDARRKMHKLRDHALPYPDWQGESLEGKNILVLAEQGIGDEIWAASMFADLVAVAAHCIIECEPRLVTLLKRSFPQATIVPRLAHSVVYPKEHPADVKLPAMSLARWLRCRFDQFPGKVGYLAPDPERQSFWRWRVGQLGAGLKVGISWRSMNIAGTRNDSYTALSQWGEILSVPGIQFVNLQYGECQAEIDEAEAGSGVRIRNFRDIDLKDGFDDVAALISELDVVIAPDNTVGAMAGAMNIPLLQFVPSKYWSCHGKDYHPWFPSVRLFFRPWDHSWEQTLRSLANELKRRSQQAVAIEGEVVDSTEERRLLRQRVDRGGLFLMSNLPEKAKGICLEILALRPMHSDAMLLLGAVERKLGNLDAAEQALVKAIAIDPLLAEAENMLGAVRLDRGAPAEAEPAFLRALGIRPSYPDALNNLGTSLAMRGQLEEAIQHFREAIDAFSGFVVARYNLASALDVKGDFDPALVEYLTVVEADPGYAGAWNNLGILYGKLGREDDSIDAYRNASSARPDDPAVRINLAKQILRGGADKREAIALLNEAVELRPEDGRLCNTLGVAYAMQDEMEKACETFRRATELAPDYAEAFRNLGVTLQKLGRLEAARDALQRAIQIASTGSQALH